MHLDVHSAFRICEGEVYQHRRKRGLTQWQFAEMNSCEVAYAVYLCVLSGKCVTALHHLHSTLCTAFFTGSVVVTPRKS